MPPGQCVRVPGRVVKPQLPPATAPCERNAQVGAGGRGDAHGLGAAQALDVVLHARLGGVVGQQARQRLGVFVADVDDARAAALQDGGQLGRVHQAFDGAVHHQRAAGQRARPPARSAGSRSRRRWSAWPAWSGAAHAGQHQRERLRARGAPPPAGPAAAAPGGSGFRREWPRCRRAAARSGAAPASKASTQAGSMISCSMNRPVRRARACPMGMRTGPQAVSLFMKFHVNRR